MSKPLSTLTAGCAAVFKLLGPRVPDGLLLGGFACFGIGVYQLNPHAIWLYSGAVLVWAAFGMAANQRGGGA